ncbi:MAG: DNA-3-methyladenine glycosylase 2 family protein [Hyphomonas sp.]|uniref:DNA-3-methyladenine glycosylase family protein n=1 Tax=Hyphomonas sp. TaxID=87 RepID=UPI003527D047
MTPRKLKAACEELARRDIALERAYRVVRVPEWRKGDATYAVLAKMIAYQQITTKAATTIWGRVEDFLGEVTPEAVLACDQEALRACGLSRPKLAHLNSIAEAVVSGALNLERVAAAEIDSARAEMLAVRGIGPWTADLFLLYAARNMDAFPAGDVGLMEAHKRLGGYTTRMTNKEFSDWAERWRPYRGVAAHLLWGWLNAERAKTGQPPA